MNCRPAGSEGFALLEVAIAGAILAFALVGLALMFSSSEILTVNQGHARVALHLAQQKIEKLRGLGFGVQAGNYPSGGVNTGCPGAEPCYKESIAAGWGRSTTSPKKPANGWPRAMGR